MTQNEVWLLKEKYNGVKTEEFLADCKRLSLGEPVAYIIGHIPFLNSMIFLDSLPLIPRPETEFWLEKIITQINFIPNQCRGLTPTLIRVLDLCAGSGCIGIAVLKAILEVRVDFVEIDEKHHSTIKKNIRKNDIEVSRTRIFGGNLFEKIADTYDFILSNPPYIDPVLDRTEMSVVKYEPSLALYGGAQGIEIIGKIIIEAPKYLNEDGMLVIEHEPEQVVDIHHKAQMVGFVATTESDQYGIPRYTCLSRGNIKIMGQ